MYKAKHKQEAKMEVQYILIIENGSLDRTAVSSSLQLDGLNVQYANSTVAGLEAIIKSRPFLIVVDVNAQKIGATVFARILKNDDDTKDIKIVAFSDTMIHKPLVPFDNLIYTDGKEQLLVKGIRIYLVTLKTIISTIIFKNTAYETNY
ncbi:MAG: hypothetical protein V4677_06760 [Bacteroidota bacterium]